MPLLAPFQGKAIITSHAALGYFCYDYNLVQIAVECEGKSPLPQTVDRALTAARNSDAQCVFTFPGHSDKGALFLAKDLELKTYEIDPLSESLLKTIEHLAIDIAKKP